MSMNLAFRTPDGGYEDFPFQTSTELTYDVMDEPDDIKKLELIEQEVNKIWSGEGEEEMASEWMAQIKQMMQNGCTLVMV